MRGADDRQTTSRFCVLEQGICVMALRSDSWIGMCFRQCEGEHKQRFLNGD
jgi:hypothetical protein